MNTITHVENLDALAKAIVIQGVEDYKQALIKKAALEKELHNVNKTVVECEKFFKSQWCKELSELDTNFIIDNARATADKEAKGYRITVTVRMKKKKNDDE